MSWQMQKRLTSKTAADFAFWASGVCCLARGIRGPLDPRIAGEMDGHVEVGDAANAAAEQPDRTR